MKRINILLAATVLGLFSTGLYATQIVLQQGVNGYSGTEDSQIKGGSPNSNLGIGNEYAITNCNT